MQFFLIELDYRAPLARVQESSSAHRAHLQSGIDQGLILCAGPRVPRDGGFVIARADTQATLEAFFALDPYLREGLAEYRYRQFEPLRFNALLTDWAGSS